MIEKAGKGGKGKGKGKGKGGFMAKITTDGEGDSEVITKIVIGGGRGKKKDN